MFKSKKKCFICGKRDGYIVKLEHFIDPVYYTYYYHKECLIDFSLYPDRYSTDVIKKCRNVLSVLDDDTNKIEKMKALQSVKPLVERYLESISKKHIQDRTFYENLTASILSGRKLKKRLEENTKKINGTRYE